MLNYLWAVMCVGIEGSMVIATDCIAIATVNFVLAICINTDVYSSRV